MGLNAALATAGRSLEVFTAGLQVAGQNIANSNTPGYVREEARLAVNAPYSSGSLIFGTGVFVEGIVQQIDLFLETRIHQANSAFSSSNAIDSIYKQLEAEIGELTDTDISTGLSTFLGNLNDVVNQPESGATREVLIQEGTQLAQSISDLRVRIDELRKTQSVAVDQLVKEANSLIDKITTINPQISKAEASGLLGSQAGALRTERYAALNRLSEIIPITFRERKDGAVDVFTGTDYLVLTGQSQHLETSAAVDRDVAITNIRLTETHSILGGGTDGELLGIIEGRDLVLGGFVDELNQFSSNLIHKFNEIHSGGEGLVGFESITSENAILDSSLALNAAGLGLTPTHGSFELKVTNKLDGTTTTTTINIDLDGIGTDTTLDSLRASLDGIANVSASITAGGKLQIDADSNFEFKFANDDSKALAALGLNTFFVGSDSGSIGVNSIVQNDHRFLAVSQGGGPSDGSNAVELATFLETPLDSLNGSTLDEFYLNMVGNVGQASATQGSVSDGYRAFQEALGNQRAQYSGVSIDEEAIRVLEFQRSYQAAARMISTIDELLGVLLSV